MHMVGHATDLDGLHLILPRDATQERPEPIAQLRRNEGASFFGAKDAMVIGAHVGHAAIQPSLRDFGNIQLASPNVETLGYCRDVPPGQDEQVCSRDTTIAGQKPLENPRNPLLSRPPVILSR